MVKYDHSYRLQKLKFVMVILSMVTTTSGIVFLFTPAKVEPMKYATRKDRHVFRIDIHRLSRYRVRHHEGRQYSISHQARVRNPVFEKVRHRSPPPFEAANIPVSFSPFLRA